MDFRNLESANGRKENKWYVAFKFLGGKGQVFVPSETRICSQSVADCRSLPLHQKTCYYLFQQSRQIPTIWLLVVLEGVTEIVHYRRMTIASTSMRTNRL